MYEADSKKTVIKKIVIFMFIMSIITLIFMIVMSFMGSKSGIKIDPKTVELVQLETPKDGDTIAVIETSLGEIRAVLYPEYAPNAVKNFTELAESGYYNNTYVFHAEEGAFFAAGSQYKVGLLEPGYKDENEFVKRETHQNLWPFRGALCAMTTDFRQTGKERMFGGGTYYNGSRFLFVNSITLTEDMLASMREATDGYEPLIEAFVKLGGIPNFSQDITVFGQAYEGLDIVGKLSNLDTDPTDSTSNIPYEDIMIISVTIQKFEAKNENH